MDADLINILPIEHSGLFKDIQDVLEDRAVAIIEEDIVQETWEREGFADEEAYREYWQLVVNDLLTQSKDKFLPRKRNWMYIEKRVELLKEHGSQLRGPTTDADLVLTPQALEKAVSIQLEGRPRPYFEPLQTTDEQFVAGLNFYKDMVCDSQKFDLKLAHTLTTAKKFSVGVLKITIDYDDPSDRLMGQKGKIVIEQIDPRYIWPDPTAKDWTKGAFLICAEPMDLELARAKYPAHADKIKPDSASLGVEDEDKASRLSNLNDNNSRKLGRRERVTIKECWLRDITEHFEPQLDPDGRPVLDADGEALGQYVRTYPHGRVLIVAGDELVFDGPNPYRHGRFPFVVLNDRISSQLFPTSDCEILLPLEDKISVLHKDMYKNMRANINAPWKTDTNAFDSPDKYDQLSAEEAAIIITNPGGVVERMPPQDLPGSAFSLVSWTQSEFNDLSGVSDINQGNLQKGAQLSADAISQLQGSSNANIKLKQQLLEQFLKDAGYILQWDIRELCDNPQEIKLNNPSDGQQVSIKWNGSEDQPDYAVNIQVTSSLPGNKAGTMQTSMSLWKEDLIDRQAALDQIKYPGRGEIVKRMQEREEKLAALGIQAKMRNKNGSAGRRSN